MAVLPRVHVLGGSYSTYQVPPVQVHFCIFRDDEWGLSCIEHSEDGGVLA